MHKAASAEKITQSICLEEEPAYGRYETENAQRERERGTKSITLLTRMQQLQIMNNQPLQKVSKTLYIVTHLGQLPFRLFTQMARTWALKEDSVNTSIIHWYSTPSLSLPPLVTIWWSKIK